MKNVADGIAPKNLRAVVNHWHPVAVILFLEVFTNQWVTISLSQMNHLREIQNLL